MLASKPLTLTRFGYYQYYSRTSKSDKVSDSLQKLKCNGKIVRGIELGTLISECIRFKTRVRKFPMTQYKTEKVLYQYGRRLQKRLLELVSVDIVVSLMAEFDALSDSEKIECIEHLKVCGFISDEEFHTGTF